MAGEVGLHALVRGRVQGVSFRYFVLRKARSLALKGYVRNLPEGYLVEVVAEGGREGLEELLRHLHQGPPGADVKRVDVFWVEGSGCYKDFQVVHRMPENGFWNDTEGTV